MKRPIIFLMVLTLALLVGGAPFGFAQGAPCAVSYDIPWDAMTGGTEQMGSTNYMMYGTAGQAVAESSDSDSFQLGVGFWYGVAAEYKIYLPVVLRS